MGRLHIDGSHTQRSYALWKSYKVMVKDGVVRDFSQGIEVRTFLV